jgi:hypothetical protein
MTRVPALNEPSASDELRIEASIAQLIAFIARQAAREERAAALKQKENSNADQDHQQG